MELNQSSTYYALVSSYMYMYYGSSCCQFMCNGWGRNRVFGKTEDYGFLSVKKVKTKFLAKWRTEDWRFLKYFCLWRPKKEGQREMWRLSVKIGILSAKNSKSTLAGLTPMGDTAPQTVHQPLSQLEFQARSFGQIPKSHQLMESLLLLFVMGLRVIHFVITIHLAQLIIPLNTLSQQELSSFGPRADKQGLHNHNFSSSLQISKVGS